MQRMTMMEAAMKQMTLLKLRRCDGGLVIIGM